MRNLFLDRNLLVPTMATDGAALLASNAEYEPTLLGISNSLYPR